MARQKNCSFVVRYTEYRCPKCNSHLGRGQTAYRYHGTVYCLDCHPDSPGRKAELPKPRRTRRAAPPDPTRGGGAMPGEHCATCSADGVWRYEFGSVDEAVQDALDDYAQNSRTQEYLRKRLEHALSGKDDWTNNFTKGRLLEGLRDPSRHLLEAVDRMRERLIGEVAAPSTPRRKVRRGQEFGEELDADRWLTRSLAPWDRNVRERQPSRTVTIGCNLSVNANVTPEQLLYRGAAALALADILTSRGVNVGIVLFDSRRNPTAQVEQSVIRHVVKDPLMPLDVSAVAFAMCEIAFFRAVCALGGMRHFPGAMNESFGSAANLPAADRQGLDYLIEADVLSEHEAAEWLSGCMARSEQGRAAGAESEVCHV